MGRSLSIIGPAVQQGLGIGARIGTWRSAPAVSVPAALRAELEAERRRWFLWLPVLLGAGAASFFALPAAPSAWAGLIAASTCAAATALAIRGWRARGLTEAAALGLAALCLGFALAQLRLHLSRPRSWPATASMASKAKSWTSRRCQPGIVCCSTG